MGKTGRHLHTGRVDYTDPDGHPWRVLITWAEIDGRAEPVGLAIMSFAETEGDELVGYGGDLRPIRSSVLRGDIMSVVESDRRFTIDRARSILAVQPHFDDDEHADEFEAAATELRLHTTGRGRKLTGADGELLPTDEALAQVAAIYTAAWQEGRPPTKAVAEALGISRTAAGKRVRRARDAGHLPETTRGKQKGGRS